MSSTQIVVTVIVVLAVLALAGFAWIAMRHRSLRNRFGPEYDRVVAERNGRAAAERELRERERRHAALDLKPLAPESRAQYAADWEEVQARFIEAPAEAVRAADELVTRLIAERGYPTEDYEEQLAQLSVEHARTLGHYRDAHEIYLTNERGEASTEQLRQALVHYRALFADLLGQEPVPGHVRQPDEPGPSRSDEPATSQPDQPDASRSDQPDASQPDQPGAPRPDQPGAPRVTSR